MSSFSEQQKPDISTPLPELSIRDLEQMHDEEFWRCARQRAQIVAEPLSHAEYIECKLSSETCWIALRELVEVLPPPHRLARLPGMPSWMAGITAWRGEAIAVVDLDRYLLTDTLSWRADGMLLVTRAAGHTLGLLVPVLGLTTAIEREQIIACTPSAALVGNAELVAGIYKDMPLLNMSTLLARLVQQIGMVTAHG